MPKAIFFIIIFGASYLFYFQYNKISKLKEEKIILQNEKNINSVKSPVIKSKLLNWKKTNKDLVKKSELITQVAKLSDKRSLNPELAKFTKEAYLDLSLPKLYGYSYFDDFQISSKSLVVLQGINDLGSISIIGAKYVTNDLQNLILTLSKNVHLFSGLSSAELIELSKSNVYPYPSTSGIKKISLLEYKTAKKSIYASYVVRADLNGSYFILVSSSPLMAKKTLLSILNSLRIL